MIEDGLRWMRAQHKAHASQEIVYQRGVHCVSVLATVGRGRFEQFDEGGGVVHAFESTDWIIDKEDLVFGESGVIPMQGDMILQTESGETVRYEVLSLGASPCFESDPHGILIRVHTKKVSP